MDLTSKIPVEILHHIFSFLDGDEIFPCLGVSKRWRQILNTDRIWRPICLKVRIFDPFPDSADILPLCSWAKAYFLCRCVPMHNWHDGTFQLLIIEREDSDYFRDAWDGHYAAIFYYTLGAINLYSIYDNTEFNGLTILRSFIEEGKSRNVPIHLILSEYELTNFDLAPNIVIHKYFPDPWRLLSINDDQKKFELMVDKILNQTLQIGAPALVLIDSIASILNYVDLHLLCSSIQKLTAANKKDVPVAQVVTLLHSELIPDDSKEYKHLNYIATSEINLRLQSDRRPALDLIYKQLNGKVQKETYNINYNTNKELEYEIRKDPPKNKKPESDNILVKTTFKLTLEEKEKESRSQVILPYTKTSNTSGKGRIYYEPDANDDWDDEDPDDDLEI